MNTPVFRTPELSADVALTLVVHEDATNKYLCEALPQTAKSSPAWRVARLNKSTGETVWAGDGGFGYAATDLATVAALTYTLGA